MWASAPTKTTCVFSVGDDTLIAPWGASTERSGKTDMAVPPATGRCGHRPLQKLTCVFTVGGVTHKNNVCFQRRGRCPHRPVGCVSGAVRKNGHGCTVSRGPMWASAPTNLIIVFLLCNLMRFYFLHSSFISCGDLKANASTSTLEAFTLSTTSDFVCRGRCPHGPAMEFDELSRKTNKSRSQPLRPMWASALW